MLPIHKKMKRHLTQDPQIMTEIESIDKRAANQSHYITTYARCPIYQQTGRE